MLPIIAGAAELFGAGGGALGAGSQAMGMLGMLGRLGQGLQGLEGPQGQGQQPGNAIPIKQVVDLANGVVGGAINAAQSVIRL